MWTVRYLSFGVERERACAPNIFVFVLPDAKIISSSDICSYPEGKYHERMYLAVATTGSTLHKRPLCVVRLRVYERK